MTIERSGAGAPDRLLPLLWRRTRPAVPAGPGRRPRLSVDAVVRAAVALADADGLGGVAMSRLAAALGVGTMTLYTYVPSKAELVDLMVDEVLAERALPAPGEPRPEHWREQVALYAQRTLAMHRRHPWLRHVSTVRPPIGPGMLAEREYVLSTLTTLRLSPEQLDLAALAISTFVTSAVALEVEEEQVESATGQSTDSWWQERGQLWEDYFDVERHPTMTAVWNAGGFAGDPADGTAERTTTEQRAAAHAFGLARLLDGIATGARPAPGDRGPSDVRGAVPERGSGAQTGAVLEDVRVDHVVIAVSDWERSTAFYRDVLGAQVVDHPDGRVAFRFGDQQLNVHGPGLDVGPLVARPPVVPGGSDLCLVWPGSDEELAQHLAEHAVDVEAGPVVRHGGAGPGRSTYFRDPDGSLLEFIVYART